MPKGFTSYKSGGERTCIKCECMESPRTFTTQKQLDMFVRLHRKKCEIMRTADILGHTIDRGTALQNLQLNLGQSLHETFRTIDEKLFN